MLPTDWQSWHAGQAGKPDAHGSGDGNACTISIECIMDGSGSEKDKRAEDNCARLVAWLLSQYHMNTKDNLFSHNYWCNVRNGRTGTKDQLNKQFDGYKGCPIYIRPHWDEFVAKVNSYMSASPAGASPAEASPGAAASTDQPLYRIQLGAYKVYDNAVNRLKEVREHFPEAQIVKVTLKK